MNEKQQALKDKLLGQEGVYLYGTTPPRAGSSVSEITAVAEKLAARLAGLPLDGLVCYDIQEEEGRTSMPRPFPYMETVDNRIYSAILREKLGLEVLNYRCVVDQPEAEFGAWLTETAETYGVGFLSLVGGATSARKYGGVSLGKACELTAARPSDFLFGGVTIPERHMRRGTEHENVLRKSRLGMDYFISQAIYRPGAFIALLNDYLNECDKQGLEPRKLILTFAPCGREKTFTFMKWLGIDFADGLPERILAASNPVQKSVDICVDNLKHILDAFSHKQVSLGLNIESVSIFKAEIDASVDLFGRLHEVLYGQPS